MELDIRSQLTFDGHFIVMSRRTAAEIAELLSDAKFELRADPKNREMANELEQVAIKLDEQIGD